MARIVKRDPYFEWIYDKMCDTRFPESVTFRKLLSYLHNTEFVYSIPRDENRAEDGRDLRKRFNYETGAVGPPRCLPCSVLEMMVALVIRAEETIMDDPLLGNRTAQWFWGMIVNLGLGNMDDTRFDERHVDYTITRFLDRRYSPDGKGGLFTIKNCNEDLRNVEIWYQLNWYLDTIV